MFVIGLGDGLGNQMFQYAFYYSMKKRYSNSTVLFDKEYFYGSVNKHNGIEIQNIFGLELPCCTKKQALALCDYHIEIKKQHPIISTIWGMRKMIYGAKKSYLTIDDATAYYSEVYDLNPLRSYYLRGNWINPLYFDDYRDELLDLYEFSQFEDENNIEFAKRIKESCSVSVHIRAGDYINNPDLEQMGREYYLEALKRISEKSDKSLSLYIFSDDKEYAQKMFFDIDDKVIIDCNRGGNSYRDMQLMSLCKHNIISNSTFGFWGAYLNKNAGKIVVAPHKASRNCMNPFACKDWILL